MKLKLAALSLSMFLMAGCGGGSSGGTSSSSGDDPLNTDGGISPIVLSDASTIVTDASAENKYYKVKLRPSEHVTVLARSVGGAAHVSLYATDDYLISQCIVGQQTDSAHSCIGGTDENGYVYFGIEGGETGSQITIDMLQIEQNMHTIDAPLDITEQLPFQSRSNMYATYENETYTFIDGDTLYVHALNPGQHYKVRVDSPDLRATLKIYYDNGFGDYEAGDECPVLDEGKGISECEVPANTNGEIFILVEPVFGAAITEYTLSMLSVEDYTGIYDGSPESPKILNYADLPYNGGWPGTFTEGYYRVVGLEPFKRYEVTVENYNSYGNWVDVEGANDRVGTADENGTLGVNVDITDGTFIMNLIDPPVNEGNLTDPVLIDNQTKSFAVQVGQGDTYDSDGYSYYQVTGLTPGATYYFAVSDKTYGAMEVWVKYSTVWEESDNPNTINDAEFNPHDADINGNILIRVKGTRARANVAWTTTAP
ncbi:hypothetical protein WCX49_04225 [Sulfurimonas sp. HSL-1656]|uniref:hypothetical protein n=1 Tax=Thiomicrolovo subterrani TaxID=3131934 RepID=UPI0031F9EADD